MGILAGNPQSGWGRTRFIQTAPAVPSVLSPHPGSPQRRETEPDTDTPGPGGLELVKRVGWGYRSLGVGGAWGSYSDVPLLSSSRTRGSEYQYQSQQDHHALASPGPGHDILH